MNGVDLIRSKESTLIDREQGITLSFAKLCEWIAAEATFQLFNVRFGEYCGECEHRCCGVHPIGSRSFDGCLDCEFEREHFAIAYFQDPPLYIAAIEAAITVSGCLYAICILL